MESLDATMPKQGMEGETSEPPVTVKDALDDMRNHPNDADVQQKALKSLLDQSESFPPEYANMAMEATCTALRKFPQDIALQLMAIQVILALLEYLHEEGEHLAAKAGCIRAALKAMRMHASDSRMQFTGCCLLWVYTECVGEDYAREMWREGAADTVFEAMSLFLQQYPDQDEHFFFHQACKVLAMMHACEFKEMAKPLGTGATVMLRVMATHKKSPDVLASALEAVKQMTAHETLNADVLGNPCVKLIVDAMHAHEDHEAVVDMGLHALAMMAKSSAERKSYMHELSAIRSTVLMMRKHAQSFQVQDGACRFFANVFDGKAESQATQLFLEHGGVDAALCAMGTHSGKGRLQLTYLNEVFLHLLAGHGAYLLKAGLHTATIRAMQSNQDFIPIQMAGSRIFTELMNDLVTSGHTHAAADLYGKAIPIVLKALSAHIAQACVQRACLLAIRCMYTAMGEAVLETFQSQVERHGIIAVFAKSMRAHKTDEYITNFICRSIGLTCFSNKRIQDQCRELGIIDLLLEAIDVHKDDHEILFLVKWALVVCSQENITNLEYIDSRMPRRQVHHLARCTSHMDPRPEKNERAAAESRDAEVCANCGKSASKHGVTLLRCSACKIAPTYCGVECQRAAWPGHKAECKANRKA
jgi:hypothetical protein